jgi:SEC-C motif-containing protein
VPFPNLQTVPQPMARSTPPDPCPCGSSRAYADCCGRWHAGTPAPDAERLMRSRYSAFVLQRPQYLLDTWHPHTRPATLELDEPGLKWLGLEVRSHRVTGPDTAEVDFVARSKVGGRAHRLHERSRFERIDGRWFYIDGDLL